MLSTHKVLIIEDQAAMRRLLYAALENAGYALFEAGDGASGLALVHELRPDLIILDVILPDLDGVDVCRQIKATTAIESTPVILLSASEEECFEVAGLQAGASYCLRKPFSMLSLLEKIRELLP